MVRFNFKKKYIHEATGLLLFLGLYLSSLYSYLLFHSLAEIFSIVIASCIFVIAWNSRQILNNNYLLFIGIAYLFVSSLDLIHTLAYTGMGVLKGYEANLPTQLWIAARYMQSISLLIAPLLFRRMLKVNRIFLWYTFATSILLLSIFSWDLFPDCFNHGIGLTPFKKASEYIISLILLGSIALLLKNQREFDRSVLQWLIWSIILTIVSELAFTFYVDVYGLANLIGHFFKIISFYLIYKAIIETGLRRPYDLLSRDLRQREEALRRSRDELETRVQERTEELEKTNKKLQTEINERRLAERRIQSTNALLSLFSKKPVRKEYLDAVVDLIQNWSSCRCVGIRVLSRQGNIPYESYTGFTHEFWESENFLSVKNDQCACIRVILGEIDPQDTPVVTPAGSFCCGNTLNFIQQLSERDKMRYRGVCIENGFFSIAVIPIRYSEKILGAIHLADETENKVSFKSLEFIESMAPLIGEAINRFNLEEELRESESRLRLLSSELLTIQEAERKRIAREIHDSLGQSLSAIKFKTENIVQQMNENEYTEIAHSLKTILPIIQESIEESRRIQMDLRPSILDDLGIIATLSWFTREFQKTYSDITIDKQIDIQENEVPDPLKTVIYRISQEALNNIAKHSKATLVFLSLKKVDHSIELTIQDNGKGFNSEDAFPSKSAKKGFGLSSMRERAELSGGSFMMESMAGKGTIIRASWPI